MLLKTILCLAAAYLAMVVFLYWKQRDIIFQADTTPVILEDTALEDTTLEGMTQVSATTTDGLSLVATYAPATQPDKPTLLFFHGNGGNIYHRFGQALFFKEAGYGVYLAEYRGYGGNPGSPSEHGLALDALAHLKKVQQYNNTIIVVGESLGTAVATTLASQHPEGISGLILASPFTSLLDIAQHDYWFVPFKSLLLKDSFDSLEKIKTLKVPLLVLHGEADDTVPASMGQRLYDAAPSPKQLHRMPDLGHDSMGLYANGGLDHINDFIENSIP